MVSDTHKNKIKNLTVFGPFFQPNPKELIFHQKLNKNINLKKIEFYSS